MRHVFVETNWVVAYAAPAHQRLPIALSLAQRAAAGELRLYIPSVCLTEARHPIRTRFNPRLPADSLRKYLGWARSEGKVPPDQERTVRQVLDRYESAVSAELEGLDERLKSLIGHPGAEVFALRNEMFVRAVELSTQNLELKPFDQTILAAVLVRAEELRDQGANDISFCELDSDLQPWDKDGRSKQLLTSLRSGPRVGLRGLCVETPASATHLA